MKIQMVDCIMLKQTVKHQFQVCKTSGWSVIDIQGADGADGVSGADGEDGTLDTNYHIFKHICANLILSTLAQIAIVMVSWKPLNL